MANLGLIDFQLGLYIKLNVNNGQYIVEVDISKHWAKIGQMPPLGKYINGHHSVIFHPILKFFFFKCSFFEDKSNSDNN